MGTTDFAVLCLEKILRTSSIKISAVVTVPDKPAGRSLAMRQSPVKIAAMKAGIPVFQPVELDDPQFLGEVKSLAPDVAAVVAFRILPPGLFTLPVHGCINLHASLLPDLRGAAPIQWALMRGYTQTGVTTFRIDRKVDTGETLLQRAVDIHPDDNADSLSARLSEIGGDLLLETLTGIDEGSLEAKKQSGKPTSAPKITKEICQIDWSRKAIDIHNQIRGLASYPAAFTFLHGKMLKLFRSRIDTNLQSTPGLATITGEGTMIVGTGDFGLIVEELQMEGRRRMNYLEFLRGRHIQTGTTLG